MLTTPGLRVSFSGGAIFFFGLFALVFLPLWVALTALVLGGMGVWGGFLWTLFSYYGPAGDADGNQ